MATETAQHSSAVRPCQRISRAWWQCRPSASTDAPSRWPRLTGSLPSRHRAGTRRAGVSVPPQGRTAVGLLQIDDLRLDLAGVDVDRHVLLHAELGVDERDAVRALGQRDVHLGRIANELAVHIHLRPGARVDAKSAVAALRARDLLGGWP